MAKRPTGKISTEHALTSKEVEFCKVYVAFGYKNHTDAYRRAFCIVRQDSTFVEPPAPHMSDQEIRSLPTMLPKEMNRKASTLLKQDHILAYIDEIAKSAGDHARRVIADTARFGKPSERMRAADAILAAEDKLGQRDAVERWVEILCEVGADIEVPLPHECPHCGYSHDLYWQLL